MHRARRERDPEKESNRTRAIFLRKKYGLSITDVDKMMDGQGGVCAICKTSEFGAPRPHIDHCHATGIVRGLLCRKCNVGLGHFDEDTDRMFAAIAYLLQHKQRRAA